MYQQSILDLDNLFNFNTQPDTRGGMEPRWARKARERQSRLESQGDRLVPMVQSVEGIEDSHHSLVEGGASMNALKNSASPSKQAYYRKLRSSGDEYRDGGAGAGGEDDEDDESNMQVLTFVRKPRLPSASFATRASESRNVLYSMHGRLPTRRVCTPRHIPTAPERVLDAPNIQNDYYLNLVSWGARNDLAVALGAEVYLWSAETGAITRLLSNTAEDSVTSVRWMGDGAHLAVGTATGNVMLWDAEQQRQVRNMRGHTARVGALSWYGATLASGSRDTDVFFHDVRQREHHTATLRGHTQEVCGLEWSPSGTQLATGGNDNLLNVWEPESVRGTSAPRFTMTEHMAAVKAIAWCPWQSNTLATGGGTNDRTIRLWNTSTGAALGAVDTHSQVTSLQWSRTHRELVSTHGYSRNQLAVWRFPTLERTAELVGHTGRVISSTLSPNGDMLCTAGADETLRFWRIWPSRAEAEQRRQQEREGSLSCLKGIR